MKREISEAMRRALGACRRHFAYALSFSALVNVLFIVPMLYMLQVYERVVPTRGSTTLMMLTLALVLGLLTMSALDVIRSRLLVRAGVRFDRYLSGVIFKAALKRPDRSGQRLARLAVREFDVLRQALTGPAIMALLDAPWVPVYVLIAFLLPDVGFHQGEFGLERGAGGDRHLGGLQHLGVGGGGQWHDVFHIVNWDGW